MICDGTSRMLVRLLCSTKESGVSFKMSSVSFLVSAPCTPSLSRNRINLQLYRLHWLYLYGPVAKDRAYRSSPIGIPCCLSVSDCHFLCASWLMFRATFTLWLSSHRRNGILVGVVRYFAQYTSRFPCFSLVLFNASVAVVGNKLKTAHSRAFSQMTVESRVGRINRHRIILLHIVFALLSTGTSRQRDLQRLPLKAEGISDLFSCVLCLFVNTDLQIY